jgi:signal transduction histidine kinase
LIGEIDTASSADRARVLANLSETAGALVHNLQDERVGAVRLLGAGGEQVDERAAAYAEVQLLVDQADLAFQSQSDTLAEVPDSYRELLGTVYGQLAQLPQTRGQVTNGGIGIIAVTAFYEDTIRNLISLRDLAAQLAAETTDTALSDRMRATVAVSQAKEFLSQRRVVGHVVLIRGAYNPYLRTAYIGAEAGLQQSLQVFNVVATDSDLALLDEALGGAEARQSQLYQGNLNSLDSGSLQNLPWDADTWDEALSAHSEKMREAERELDAVVAADATVVRDAATQQVLVQAGALLAVLLIAILLAWLVARSMVRSLRNLRQGALSVAQYGLPQAVARLRDPSLSTQLSPGQVASQIAEPLPVRSKDEFGQVAEAFNVVHLEAVRTAAEQAQLRSSVAAMFVNLARRSQILVDRLIGQLDRLERGEEDPDRLADLFQLDHLATRMRRTDENLLVLAGADSTRVQRDPAGMLDVLRAAQSEVEQYTRIEFGVIDRDLEVAAHAVNDLVHLVAELLDNATVFSPPDSHVLVEARRIGDRAVLYVQDRGLGLSADQLADINERLATPPLVDVAVSRMMGLVVVARLAARHGVKVELRPAAERGTIADVTLPSSVLVPRALVGRPEPPPVRLEPIGEQLALESGPSAGAFAGPPGTGSPPPGPATAGTGFRSMPNQPPASFPPPPFTSPFASPPPGFASPPPADDPARHPGQPAFTPHPRIRSGGSRLPAWSDLVGATGHNGAEMSPGGSAAGPVPPAPPAVPPPAAPTSPSTPAPLPRRRPDSSPMTDRQLPSGAPSGPFGSGPSSAPSAPPPPGDGIPRQRPGIPAPAAPPPWPPVGPPVPTGAPPAPVGGPGDQRTDDGQVNGGSPESRRELFVASDQTAEIPRPYTPPPPAPPAPVGDQTMELPIFRELESVWFRAKRPAETGPGPDRDRRAEPVTASESESGTVATASRDRAEVLGTNATGRAAVREPAPAESSAPVPSGADFGPASSAGAARPDAVLDQVPGAATVGAGSGAQDDWRTAADDGWRAASSAARPAAEEVTPAGLPKRRPMAQLVPGGVDREPATATGQRRSPEAVRGLLSAYHRGVQRGRGHTTDDDMGGSGGSQSTQAGKEQT